MAAAVRAEPMGAVGRFDAEAVPEGSRLQGRFDRYGKAVAGGLHLVLLPEPVAD